MLKNQSKESVNIGMSSSCLAAVVVDCCSLPSMLTLPVTTYLREFNVFNLGRNNTWLYTKIETPNC